MQSTRWSARFGRYSARPASLVLVSRQPHPGAAHGAATSERSGVWGPRERPSRGVGRSPTLIGCVRGFTFIELLVVSAILAILASAAMPMAKVAKQRQREAELRRSLREMRTAIDKFKDAVDTGQIGSTDIRAGSEGYPPDLETLVEGVSAAGDASGRKLKFLRRIPIDPMTSSTEWGMRSYQDRPDARSWGGQNVYDVYSKSEATALDGTKYRDW